MIKYSVSREFEYLLEDEDNSKVLAQKKCTNMHICTVEI